MTEVAENHLDRSHIGHDLPLVVRRMLKLLLHYVPGAGDAVALEV